MGSREGLTNLSTVPKWAQPQARDPNMTMMIGTIVLVFANTVPSSASQGSAPPRVHPTLSSSSSSIEYQPGRLSNSSSFTSSRCRTVIKCRRPLVANLPDNSASNARRRPRTGGDSGSPKRTQRDADDNYRGSNPLFVLGVSATWRPIHGPPWMRYRFMRFRSHNGRPGYIG